MNRSRQLFAAVLLLFFAANVRAAVVELSPAADTTLIQAVPENNLGGQSFVNAGTTQNFTTNRGLFRFDIVAGIPQGARIQSAALVLEVTQEPRDGFAAALFGLHRVLQPWGEGDKIGAELSPGLGALATTNEASWNSRFALTTNTWTTPGAMAGTDFIAEDSGNQFIYGLNDSPYMFTSAGLAADVQFWLDTPLNNFGWILVCQAELQDFTARRFGSREGGINAPRLQIEFIPPPEIQSPQIASNQLTFFFNAEAGQPYTVETRSSFHATNTWSILTNISAPAETTRIDITEPVSSGARFYRVVSP